MVTYYKPFNGRNIESYNLAQLLKLLDSTKVALNMYETAIKSELLVLQSYETKPENFREIISRNRRFLQMKKNEIRLIKFQIRMINKMNKEQAAS